MEEEHKEPTTGVDQGRPPESTTIQYSGVALDATRTQSCERKSSNTTLGNELQCTFLHATTFFLCPTTALTVDVRCLAACLSFVRLSAVGWPPSRFARRLSKQNTILLNVPTAAVPD